MREAEIIAELDPIAPTRRGVEGDVCDSKVLGLFPEDPGEPAALNL